MCIRDSTHTHITHIKVFIHKQTFLYSIIINYFYCLYTRYAFYVNEHQGRES